MASSLAQPYATFLESPHSDTIECLEFIEEDRRIITGSRDGTLQVRDVDTGLLVGEPWIDTGSGAVHAMAISRNRMMILTGSEDGRIRVWEVVTGLMTGKWNPEHTATISSICWSPDELHVASGSDDGMVIIDRSWLAYRVPFSDLDKAGPYGAVHPLPVGNIGSVGPDVRPRRAPGCPTGPAVRRLR